MNRPDEDQLGAACFEADLIDARHVRVIRTQVSEIGCKWWLMTVETVEAVTA